MSTASNQPTPSRRPRPGQPSRPAQPHVPLRLVAPRSDPGSRAPFVVALVFLLGVGLVGLLVLNTTMQRRAFDLTTLDQRADALDVSAAALRMRTERLASPQRLALEAAELGMVPNTAPVFLRLSDGRVVGDPVPASTASSIPGLLPAPPTITEPRRRAGDAPTQGYKPRDQAGRGEDGAQPRVGSTDELASERAGEDSEPANSQGARQNARQNARQGAQGDPRGDQ